MTVISTAIGLKKSKIVNMVIQYNATGSKSCVNYIAPLKDFRSQATLQEKKLNYPKMKIMTSNIKFEYIKIEVTLNPN